MRRLHRQFAGDSDSKTQIVIVYQKEPHACQMAFRNVGQPENDLERLSLAKKMKSELELEMTVLVDSMEDQSRDEYTELPSPVIIIDSCGVVRNKFPWPDADQIDQAVSQIQ